MNAAKGLRRSHARVMAQWDVTLGQGRALRVVSTTPGVRISSVADVLGIAPRSATEVIDGLEARGLVSRAADPHDRRATSVLPTQEGLRVHRLIAEARERATVEYLSRLVPEDHEELRRLLGLLVHDEAQRAGSIAGHGR